MKQQPRNILSRILTALLPVLILFAGCMAKKEPLRVCVDLGYNSAGKSLLAENFLTNAKDYGAPEDVELVVIPPEGEERKGAITQLRTELAAGKGPDLFIISASKEDGLFRFPEKAMERNTFLCLDEYIENAGHMEWDKLSPVIMEAGRGWNGQYILPMSYSFPVTIYNGASPRESLTRSTTWQDMADSSDPLVRGAALMFDPYCVERIDSVFGKAADYAAEELLFSQEELLNIYSSALELEDALFQEELPENRRLNIGVDFDSDEGVRNWDMRLAPVCSISGGVTARITSWCAVNANTQRPEEAFLLLDILMGKESQQYAGLYHAAMDGSVPVYEGLITEEQPVQRWHMQEEVYQQFLDARDLITEAKFSTPLDNYLCAGYAGCQAVQLLGQGDIPHEVEEVYRQMSMELAES